MIRKFTVRNTSPFFSTRQIKNNFSSNHSRYDEPSTNWSCKKIVVVAYLGVGLAMITERMASSAFFAFQSGLLETSPKLTTIEILEKTHKASLKGAEEGAVLFYPMINGAIKMNEIISSFFDKPKCFSDKTQPAESDSSLAPK